MNPELFDRLSELFARALSVPPEERSRFLDQECAGDRALRDELENLLRLDADATAFLDGAEGADLHQVAARALAEAGQPAEPMRFEGYTLLRELGSGAMGRVHLAKQDVTGQLVALKVLRPELTSPRSVRRFQFEVEILGRLAHPGIARIYDAGTSEERGVQRPYFAMEYVRGRRLGVWLREEKPSLERRLELLAAIAEAVHHAHQHGVVHRDLKPDNVLVTEDGRPKVLDFGVGRLVDADIHLTTQGAGILIGTLSTMSPEQTLGDPDAIDVRSDVYSLGVITYEALTGRLPYSIDGLGVVQAAAVIQEHEPDPFGAVAGVPDDVETIVRKALEKEKERRYGSAAELAEDLRRFLRDEPISARPATTMYQLRKLARRKRGLAVGLVAIAAVLLVATAVSLFFAASASRARADAEWRAGVASLVAASAELRDGGLLAASNLLAQVPERLRGWEWQVLSNRADASVRVFRGHRFHVRKVAVTPDGTRLFSCAGDGLVKVWDTRTGSVVRDLAEHSGRVYSVACSPTGDRMASGAEDETVILRSATTLEPLRVLDAGYAVSSLAFSPDGTLLASGGSASRVTLWDAADGRQLATQPGHSSWVHSVEFARDGTRLASMAEGGTARIWSVPDLVELVVLETGRAMVTSVALDPTGRQAATGLANGELVLWDAVTGDELKSIEAHGKEVSALTFSPTGAHLATAAYDNQVRIWDPEDLSLRRPLVGHTNVLMCLAWSSDGSFLVSGGQDDTVRLWDTTRFHDVLAPAAREGVRLVAPGLGVDELIVASASGRLLRTDAPTGRELEEIASLSPDQGLRVDPTARRLFTTWRDDGSRGRVTDRATDTALFEFEGTVMTVSSDGERFAVTTEDHRVLVLSTVDGEMLATFDEPDKLVYSMDFAPDGRRLAAAGYDYDVFVWDLETGQLEARMVGHPNIVVHVGFDPTGRWLGSSGNDGTTRVWDLERFEEVALLPASGAGRAVAFHPGADRLASASEDGSIRIWSRPGYDELARIRDTEADISQLFFLGDGDLLVARTRSGRLFVIDGRPPAPLLLPTTPHR